MSYIGRDVDNISNVEKLDNITFDGGTTYALEKSSVAYTPSSSNCILLSIDGVVQQGNFSISGQNIVFDWSPTSSNTCDWILHFGTGLITTPADSSVTNAKLTSSVISSQSLVTADSSNDHVLIHDATDSALKKALYPSGFDVTSITGATALADVPATTDEFVISDGGTLKRIDADFVMNTPSFYVYKTATTSLADGTTTILIPTTVSRNDGTCYNTSDGKFTVPSGQDGLYFFFASFRVSAYDPNRCQSMFFVNGSELNWTIGESIPDGSASNIHATMPTTALLELSASDYVEFRGVQTSGSTNDIFNTVFGGFKIR